MANTAIADTVTPATRVLAQGGAFVADGWAAETSAAPGSLSGDSDDMIDLLDRGLSADQSGDAAGAQRLFEEVIAKYPTSAAAALARRRLGAIYQRAYGGDESRRTTGRELPGDQGISPVGEVQPRALPDVAVDARLAQGESAGRREDVARDGALRDVVTSAARDVSHGVLTAPVVAHTSADTPQAWRSRARRSHRFEQLLRTDVGDRIFFGVASAEIGTRARGVLERQAEWLARYSDLYVVVEGHADEPGSEADNDAVARGRAITARDLLIGAGVRADHIDIDVRGRKDRLATCDSPGCRSQNRRAVVRLMVVLPSSPVGRTSVKTVPDDAKDQQLLGNLTPRR